MKHINQLFRNHNNPSFPSLSKKQGSQEKRARRINNTTSEVRTQLTQFFAKNVSRVSGSARKQANVARGAGRGDTIVEVMMSLVILSMILATVYSMGARSLRVGTESNQRTEALSNAQQQIDLLVDAKTSDPNFADSYKVDQAYCLKVQPDPADSTKTIVVKDPSAESNTNKLCNNYNGTQYGIGVRYRSNVFTVTAQWPSNDAPNGTANLNLYYKLPGVYKKALVTAGSGLATGTSATINGMVNPNGSLVTDCYFNYETNPDHKYTSAQRVGCSTSPGAGTTSVNVFAFISGLNASSTYFFQLCATSLNGTACSVNNGTFTTAALPSFTRLSASAESPSGNNAVLSAQVNPNGSNITECHFEWGTTTGYGSSKACGGIIGGGTSFVPVSVNVAPLIKGTTYHFRVVATNSVGTQSSSDATFVPSSPPPPPPPPPPPTINSLSADTPPSNNYGFSISNGRSIYTSTGVSRTLRWTTTNATYCNASGGWSGNNLGANSAQGVTAYPGTNYVLTCYNASGGSSQTTYNFSYTNSYFTLWSGWCSWGPCGYTLSYGEGGQQGSVNSMPGEASGIVFGNGIGSLCANLNQRGWGVTPPTNTALCGGNYCWTFSSTTFLGNIPFNNGGNGASFNDSVVSGIAGRDCNNN